MLTIGFFLTGKKGRIALENLVESKGTKNISFVVSERDHAVKDDYYDAIEDYCKNNNLLFYNRKCSKNKKLECEYAIAMGWRWLIDTQDYKLIILHDSLLPKYRGFNPLVTALIEGDRHIGATAIEAEEEFDTGDIVEQEILEIEYPLTIKDAIDQIAILYAKIVQSLYNKILNNSLTSYKQDENKVSYSIWRNHEDYKVDWQENASKIKRFIDAVGYPYLGALTNYNGTKIRILEATPLPDKKIVNKTPGKLFKIRNNKPIIICGNGLLRIDKAIIDGSNESVIFNKLRICLK